MNDPLISIGVPVQNGEKWLRRSMDSLLAQDYPNIEIIISDNASQDSTLEICQEYQLKNNKIKIITQYTISMIDNFKAVLAAAKGKYFMWAAVDDFWDPSCISQFAEKLESNEQFAVVQSATLLVSEVGLKKIRCMRFAKNNPENYSTFQLTKKIMSPLKYNFFIYGLFRRKLLLEAFNFFPSVPSSDRWFLLQFPLAGYRFGYIDKPLYIRTIANLPSYIRYPNEEFAQNIKRLKDKWFRFEALPAVKKMIEQSSLLSNKPKILKYFVLFQLWREKTLNGFRCMLRRAVYKYSPEKLRFLLHKRRERNRKRELQF